MSHAADPLAAAASALRAFAQERSIPIIPGFFDDAKRPLAPLVTFVAEYGTRDATYEPQASMRAFTAAMEQLDVAMFVVSVDVFAEEEWQETVDAYEDAIELLASRNALNETLPRALMRIQEIRPRIGHVGVFQVRAVTRNPTVMIDWFKSAEWYEEISDANSIISDAARETGDSTPDEASLARQAEWDAQERERRVWNGTNCTEVARQLAEQAGFGQCKREAERVYMLRTLLGDDAPSSAPLLKEIAREARAIYNLEIAKRT